MSNSLYNALKTANSARIAINLWNNATKEEKDSLTPQQRNAIENAYQNWVKADQESESAQEQTAPSHSAISSVYPNAGSGDYKVSIIVNGVNKLNENVPDYISQQGADEIRARYAQSMGVPLESVRVQTQYTGEDTAKTREQLQQNTNIPDVAESLLPRVSKSTLGVSSGGDLGQDAANNIGNFARGVADVASVPFRGLSSLASTGAQAMGANVQPNSLDPATTGAELNASPWQTAGRSPANALMFAGPAGMGANLLKGSPLLGEALVQGGIGASVGAGTKVDQNLEQGLPMVTGVPQATAIGAGIGALSAPATNALGRLGDYLAKARQGGNYITSEKAIGASSTLEKELNNVKDKLGSSRDEIPYFTDKSPSFPEEKNPVELKIADNEPQAPELKLSENALPSTTTKNPALGFLLDGIEEKKKVFGNTSSKQFNQGRAIAAYQDYMQQVEDKLRSIKDGAISAKDISELKTSIRNSVPSSKFDLSDPSQVAQSEAVKMQVANDLDDLTKKFMEMRGASPEDIASLAEHNKAFSKIYDLEQKTLGQIPKLKGATEETKKANLGYMLGKTARKVNETGDQAEKTVYNFITGDTPYDANQILGGLGMGGEIDQAGQQAGQAFKNIGQTIVQPSPLQQRMQYGGQKLGQALGLGVNTAVQNIQPFGGKAPKPR